MRVRRQTARHNRIGSADASERPSLCGKLGDRLGNVALDGLAIPLGGWMVAGGSRHVSIIAHCCARTEHDTLEVKACGFFFGRPCNP